MPRALCALAMTHYRKCSGAAGHMGPALRNYKSCGINPAGGQGRPPLRVRKKRDTRSGGRGRTPPLRTVYR